MITGVHAIIFSTDAAATREFFRDTLGLPSIDAGQGWLIRGSEDSAQVAKALAT